MKCEDCKKRKAIISFSNEPMLSITHGWGMKQICRQCFIKRIQEHIAECIVQLKDEVKLLGKKKK